MKTVVIGLVLLSILATLVGCAALRPAPRPGQPVEMAQKAVSPIERPAAEPAGSGFTANGSPDDTTRMIIRTADLSLVVTDAEQAMQAITTMAHDAGGYVADSSAWREGEQLRARMTVRIPAASLDNALTSIKALAVRVDRESISGKDVTEEYTDLDAQLVNLEATEKELRELLSEVREKTQKAEDILQVYRELTNIRGEIERVKGRMQYLSTLTALATLNIELIPDALSQPIVKPGWRPLETLKNAGRALVNALKGLVNALIWLVVYVLPLLILIAIPIVLIVLGIRWWVHKRRKQRGVTPENENVAKQ